MGIFVMVWAYDVAIPALDVNQKFIFWILPTLLTLAQKLVRKQMNEAGISKP